MAVYYEHLQSKIFERPEGIPLYLSDQGIEIKPNGSMRCPNPNHNDAHPSAVWKPGYPAVYCASCEDSPWGLVTLIEIREGLSPGEARLKAARYCGIDVKESDQKYINYTPKPEPIKVTTTIDKISYSVPKGKDKSEVITSDEFKMIQTRLKQADPLKYNLSDIKNNITSGKTIRPCVVEWSKLNTKILVSTQLVFIDIDNAEKDLKPLNLEPLNHKQALEICKENNLHPFILYMTFNNKNHDECERFRMGFCLDKPITNKEGEQTYKAIYEVILNPFKKWADKRTDDITRIMLGTDDTDNLYFDEFAINKVSDLLSRGLDSEHNEISMKESKEVSDTIDEERNTFDVELVPGIVTPYLSGSYIVDDAIFKPTPLGNTLICRQPIAIGNIYKNIDTQEERVDLFYKDVVHDEWNRTIVDKATISSSREFVKLSNKGIAVNSGNVKGLVSYVDEVEDINKRQGIIKEIPSCNHFGWVEHRGSREFIPYSQNIFFDNGESFKQQLNGFDTPAGSMSEWLDEVKAIRRSGKIEINMMLLSAFASVLVPMVNILPSIVNIHGTTGGGKTVTLMLCASIYGNPNENGGYIMKASSTATAFESKISLFNNLPLLVDDFANIKTYGRDKNDSLQNLMYNVTSGRNNDRSNQNLGLNQVKSWANLILTNAERPLAMDSMNAGAINRVIDIPVNNNLYDNPQHTLDVIRDNYGHVGREWIRILTEKVCPEEVKKMYNKKLEILRREGQVTGVQKSEKQLPILALILVADELTERYIFKDGVLLEWAKIFKQLKCNNQLDEGARFYDVLHDYYTIHRNELPYRMCIDSRADKWNYPNINRQSVAFLDGKPVTVCGKIHDKLSIWLPPTVLSDIAKDNNLDKNGFILWLSQRNLIDGNADSYKDTRRAYQKKLKETNSYMYHILLDVDNNIE